MSDDDSQPRRDHVVKLRLSADELAALQERCTGRQLAPWLRSVGLGERPYKQRYPNTDPELKRQLRGIGNNINQIAYKLNSGEWTVEDRLDLKAQLDQIERDMYVAAYGEDPDYVR